MKLNFTTIFVCLLIVWSIVYIFFSHRFGQHGAQWATETFKEGATGQQDDSLDWIFGIEEEEEEILKPPPQITNINFIHDHPFHKDTYKYLSDIEQSFDDLHIIYKSKPHTIHPKVIKLSTGLNPYEYAQWQQVLPDVFSKPLYGKKCQSSDLSAALKAVQCSAPKNIQPQLSEFDPYLSHPHTHNNRGPSSQNNSSTSQNNSSTSQNRGAPSYRGRRNVITINVDDNRGAGGNRGANGKQHSVTQSEEEDSGRIGIAGKSPAKGHDSFNQTNDAKWDAYDNDDQSVGADTRAQRPG